MKTFPCYAETMSADLAAASALESARIARDIADLEDTMDLLDRTAFRQRTSPNRTVRDSQEGR